MRATPFTARLLAATALGLTTSSAYAADYGILVSDPNPAPLNLFNGSLITGDKTGLLSTGGRLNLSISGYTWIIGNGGHGGAVSPDGGIVINGDGADISLVFEDPAVSPPVVEGARFGITTAYFFNSATGELEGRATGTTVTNNGGTIIGDSDDGVRLIGGGSITNSGYIAGMSGSSADGVSMFAFEDQDTSAMTGIGTVTNLLGGTIQGQRFGVILSGGGNIDNSGMIQGNDGGGVLIQARSDVDLGKIGTVTNSGTGSILGGVRFNSLDSASLDNAGIITSANNNGSSPLRAGVESWNPLSLTNAATGDIYGATNGITSNGSSLTLDNAGTIRGDGSSSGYFDGNGGVIIAGGPATITNSGIISGARYGISTIYFTDPETGQQSGLATGTTINNSGVISGDNDDAIHLIGGGTVTNSGQLLGLNASGVVMFAFGNQDLSQVTDLGTVNNLAGGLIQGSLAVFIGDGGTVNNAGTITGDFRAVEIARWWDPGRAGAVNNSGTINGNIDFDSLDSATVTNSGTIANPTGDAIISNSTLTVDNTDTASITGSASGIRTSGPSLTVANDGTIRGNGGNGSVFNSDGGIIISGGPAAITNTGDISGARFGISTIYFTNPDNSTVGRAIGTAVGNGGSIIGENDDGIRLIGGGTVTNSGYISGRTSVGADGISMFAYNGQNTAGMTSIGSVTNLAGGFIQGNRFGVVLFGGGTVDNAGTIDHTVNVAGSPLLGAGQFGLVNNSGSIINGGISLTSLEAASVNNSGHTPTIGFAGDGTASVVNSGTVNYFTSFSTVGTATVDNGGSIGEGLVFNQTTTANVTNSGSITATNTPDVVGTTRDAVYSDAALLLTNTSTGSINGVRDGVRTDGTSATINNAGTIRGLGTNSGQATPGAGIVVAGGPSTITNSGSISGARFGLTTSVFTDPSTQAQSGRAIGSTVNNSGSIIGDNDDGVRLIGGGTVANSGYIAGRVGAAADGVSMFSFSDQNLTSFTVIGSVTNSPSGVIEGNRFGVILSNGGNVSNAGTITGKSGSILLQAQAVGAEPPRNGSVTNSGTLNGTVQFNNLANASVANSGSISALSGNGVFTTAPSGSLTVNNQATGSLAGASSGIRSEGSSLSVTNAGTIRGNGTLFTLRAADAGILILGGPATINNSGNISGAGFGITTGVYSDPNNNAASGRAAGSTVINSGSIIGDSNDGVRLIGGGTVTNSGYIAGRVGTGADGVSMFAYDDQDTTALPQIGTVNNMAGSTIEGFRFGIIQSGGGTINNAGTINGGANGAILIQTGFIGGKTGNVANSGTINGSTSFYDLTTAAVTNSGLMNGGVSFDTVPTATLANTGTINGGSSNGLTANNNVTVTNSAAGSITGASGIYSTGGSSLTLTNAGTITGGSGFGAFSAGSINISNGGAINSNSSGISSLGGGSVTNGGSIISSNGAGISFSGNTSTATLTNAAGALIQGSVQGILADSNVSATVTNAGLVKGDVALLGPSGSLSNSGAINGLVVFSGSTAALSNSGTIASAGGTAVNGVRSLTNSGVINGGTGTAVSMTSGNDTATLQTGSSISGAVDGGNGSDTLRLSGTVSTPTASQTVGRFLNFETFNVLGGYWTAPTTTGSFTTTTLSGGALAVNGTLTSPVVVNAAAMLAGTGTITGNVTMNTGGIISPGTNSIGTLNVAGNVLFNGGSTFSVQTNPNGTSDRLAVTGAVNINKGATLQVLAGIFPNYPATSNYLVMTANGGISGKFDTVVTDYAYFKATVNTQQKGTITVQIAPNGKPLPSAATVSTFSTASAVDSLGTTSPIYEKVLYQSLTGARQAFTSLSGSAYARLDGLMASEIGRVELGFDSDKSAAPTLEWSTANSFTARGLQSATAMGRGKRSLMMVGGRYSTRLATESIRADVDTRFLASAAGYRSGRFQALASVTSAWHNVSVERTIAFPGFADRTSARYAAESHRVDLEGSYALTRGAIAIAPYGGLSHLMMKSQAFEESGGVSTLAFGHDSRTIDQLRLGVRARATFALGPVKLSPHADVSFNRSWGDVEAAREARFVTGNAGFDSIGTGLDSRLTDIDAGIDAKLGRVTLTGGYRGRLGNRWRDHSALLRAALQF